MNQDFSMCYNPKQKQWIFHIYNAFHIFTKNLLIEFDEQIN